MSRAIVPLMAIATVFSIPSLSVPLLSIQPGRAQPASPLDRLRETNACPGCDLSYADLSHRDLSNANLRGAILIGANLSYSNLSRADLGTAVLNAANLSGTSFQFAILENASLLGAQMRQPADFTGANLNGLVLPSGVVRPAPEGSSLPANTPLLTPGPFERVLPSLLMPR